MAIRTTPKKPRIHIQKGYRINQVVRSALFSMGHRFRLDDGELPGKPHLVFASIKLVLFTVDCSHYQHTGCLYRYRMEPRRRDQEVSAERLAVIERVFLLRGFQFACFWDCQADDTAMLRGRLSDLMKVANTGRI